MTFHDCADTTVPVYYLGIPGDLFPLRMPKEGYTRTLEDHSVTHSLLSGAVVDKSFREQRIWELTLDYLTYAQLNVFEEIRTGARGLGPYVFIDPQTVNCFTPNIASGTNVLLTTEGFSVTGTGEVLTSTTAVAQRGTRSLAWTMFPAVTGSGGGVLCMTTSYTASGWATPPSQPWSMTGYVSGGGSDPIVTVTPRFTWLNSSGAVISFTAGSSVVTAAGSWTQFTVSGTAPSNAVYVHPRLVVTPSSVGSNTVVYVDTLLLDMRVSPRTWIVGQGQPRVMITPTREMIPTLGLTSMAYQLIELTV